MEKQRIKKTRATVQKQIQKQRQENAENNPATTKTNTIPIEIPQPFEDTWSPCASSRGVKLLISTTCASHRTLKSGDFIGAYLQAKVIGRHFVRLPLEYAYYFQYSKGFIQSQADPSDFVFYNKHNQWFRLLFFVNDMLTCLKSKTNCIWKA